MHCNAPPYNYALYAHQPSLRLCISVVVPICHVSVSPDDIMYQSYLMHAYEVMLQHLHHGGPLSGVHLQRPADEITTLLRHFVRVYHITLVDILHDISLGGSLR